MSQRAHKVTVLHIRNTPAELRNMKKLLDHFVFEGDTELHLFFWYMGYCVTVGNYLGRDSGPPDEAEIKKFIDRNIGLHYADLATLVPCYAVPVSENISCLAAAL